MPKRIVNKAERKTSVKITDVKVLDKEGNTISNNEQLNDISYCTVNCTIKFLGLVNCDYIFEIVIDEYGEIQNYELELMR